MLGWEPGLLGLDRQNHGEVNWSTRSTGQPGQLVNQVNWSTRSTGQPSGQPGQPGLLGLDRRFKGRGEREPPALALHHCICMFAQCIRRVWWTLVSRCSKHPMASQELRPRHFGPAPRAAGCAGPPFALARPCRRSFLRHAQCFLTLVCAPCAPGAPAHPCRHSCSGAGDC